MNLSWRPLLAAAAATAFALLAQRGAGVSWVGLSFACALGCLAGRPNWLTQRRLWAVALGALAVATLPVPLPTVAAFGAPLLASAALGAWLREPLSSKALGSCALGVALTLLVANGTRSGLAGLEWVIHDDVSWILGGLALCAALGWGAGSQPAEAEQTDPEPIALAVSACFRCGGLLAVSVGAGALSPWGCAALLACGALAGGAGTRGWPPRRRMLAELAGWGAALLAVAHPAGTLALALIALTGATAAASAQPALRASPRPLLALIAGGVVGVALGPALFAAEPASARIKAALGLQGEAALKDGIAEGLLRERYAAGGRMGMQVVDVGGDTPLRLLTERGRVREALPQRRGSVPAVLEAQAVAVALAAWLAPGKRLLIAGVGSGYGLSLLEGTPLELTAVEPSAGVMATWTEPGDLWGAFNRRLGSSPQRLARIQRGPLLPYLRHGTYHSVLLPAAPSPTILGAALRHPLSVGVLDLASGPAELSGWVLAGELFVFRPPTGDARVAIAGLSEISWSKLQAGWERDTELRTELLRLGIDEPAELVACLEGGLTAAKLALTSPDPAGTLRRAGVELSPSVLVEAGVDARVAITEHLAAAGSPATLRWAESAVQAERNAASLSTLGALLLNSGERERGLAHLREALEHDPAHDPARLQLAYELQRREQATEAEAFLREGVRPGEHQGALHFALARLADERGDARAALAEYQAAGQTGDAPERAHELKTTLQREHAVSTRAKAAWGLLQAAQRGEADPQQGLELALELAGLELEREDRVLLARTFDGYADLEAEPLLRTNLQRHRAKLLTPLAESDPRQRVRAAEAWLAGDRPARALELLAPVAETPAGARPSTQRLLGQAHATLGDTSAARAAFKRALSLGPALTTNGRTYEQLARLEAQDGNVPLALELLKQGDAELGGVPRLRLARAEMLDALGRKADAKEAYEAYLQVAPPGVERRKVEERLGR